MRLQITFVAAILLLFVNQIQAQKKASKKGYKNNPVWIQMMNDTSANYFETTKAFREFFKERALPKEPNEVEGEDAFEKEVGLEENEGKKKGKRELKREAKRSSTKEPDYSAEVRAFKGWFYTTQPWVRSDGSIIGPQLRQAIINQQQRELQAIEKANGKN